MREIYRPNRVGLSAVLNSFNPEQPQHRPQQQRHPQPQRHSPQQNHQQQSPQRSPVQEQVPAGIYSTHVDFHPLPAPAAFARKQDYSLPPPEAAIRARGVVLAAGEGINASLVLNGLTLTVPAGTIYGLLGPSGCGKTSIIRCITGSKRPTAGLLRVFGHEPGKRGSGVPGPGVGYMPQEIALHDDLTVSEMLMYFGRLFNLARTVLDTRIAHMAAVLDLPDTSRLIGTLSGGQKRRVSFAAALIHKPRLVILDEPTVGVDPVLRERIWASLVSAAERDKITVLVTTHYIEEARRAHVVAFMRRGRVLAEDSPRVLCKQYAASGLEQVFYKASLAEHLT